MAALAFVLLAGCGQPPEPDSERFAVILGADTLGFSDALRFTDTVRQVQDSAGVFVVELSRGRLVLYGVPAPPPLRARRAYRFAYHAYGVEFSLGAMTALRIMEVEGGPLVFLGVQRLNAEIPKGLLPVGWQARLTPSAFPRRDTGCGTHSRLLVLHLRHGGDEVKLLQGETGRLGAYAVAVQAAQNVRYDDPSCPDYVLPALSFTIQHVGTEESV